MDRRVIVAKIINNVVYQIQNEFDFKSYPEVNTSDFYKAKLNLLQYFNNDKDFRPTQVIIYTIIARCILNKENIGYNSHLKESICNHLYDISYLVYCKLYHTWWEEFLTTDSIITTLYKWFAYKKSHYPLLDLTNMAKGFKAIYTTEEHPLNILWRVIEARFQMLLPPKVIIQEMEQALQTLITKIYEDHKKEIEYDEPFITDFFSYPNNVTLEW